MNMQEMTRFILYLQHKGWSGDEINNFVLYIESGDAKYFSDDNEKKE